MERRALMIAALMLAAAVVLGAFGAHALKARLSPEALGQWRTGVEYQFYHGLGLLVVALMYDRLPKSILQWVARGFTLGVVLFSGSLYLLSTRELGGLQGLSGILGPLTPLGGLCFILGWVLLLITALRKPDPR